MTYLLNTFSRMIKQCSTGQLSLSKSLHVIKESFKKVSQNATTATLIGSIKGNICHTRVTSAEPALVKAALALKKAKIPPSINCSDPSAHLKRTNLYVNTKMKQWISPGKERRAMGSNGAAILEQHYYTSSNEHQKTPSSVQNVPFPVCISANSEYSLYKLLARVNHHLTQNTTLSLDSLAYTLLYTCRSLPLRVAHVCSTKEDITKWLASSVHDVCISRHGKMCCVMFSGQGALIHLKPLRTVSKILPRFQEEICNCFNLLKEITSDLTYSSLNELIQLDEDSTTAEIEDIERKINKGAYLQATVNISAEIALYHSLEYLGLKSDCFVGHSLGEYAAAHLAGALSIEDVLHVVYERGKLIETCVDLQRGHMLNLSIFASPDEIKEMCTNHHKGVQVICLNSPRHCTVGGTPADIDRLSIKLSSQGIRNKKINMDYVYHHPNMKVIQERFSTVLKNTNTHALTTNLITTAEDQVYMHTAGTLLSTDYWLQHLLTPSDFLSTLSDCLPMHCKDFVFVELGLVPTLVHFIEACSNEMRDACVSVSTQSRNDTEIQKQDTSLLTDLTNIWKLGINVELHKLPCFKSAKRIKLPLYPFDTNH